MPRSADPTASPARRFAPLDDDQVRGQTDSGSFSRGRSYFRNGHIINPVLRANTIEAQCLGSEPWPYRVTATLAPADQPDANPVGYACTCPRGGFCKHIVALLLTWIYHPGWFAERPPLATQLAGRSPEELIAIIERMVDRYPDLEHLVDLPMPVVPQPDEDVPANVVTIDAGAIRRQVRAVYAEIDVFDPWDVHEHGVTGRIASEVAPLIDLGRQLASAGQWANAHAVLSAIAEEMIEETNWQVLAGDDAERSLVGLLTDVGQALGEVLDAQTDLPEDQRLPADGRAQLIRTIYDLRVFDVFDSDGFGVAGESTDVLVHATTPEERATIEGWLRAESAPDNRHAGAVVGFIARLRAAADATLEEILPLYREVALWEDVARITIELGRVDEAAAIAGRHIRNPCVLQRIAVALVARGDSGVERGIALVDDLLWEIEGTDPPAEAVLEGWLMERYRELGRPGQALEMAQRRFRRTPSPETFQEVRRVATMPGQPEDTWQRVRPDLLERMQGAERLPALIQVLLAEGDAAGAPNAYRQLERQKPDYTRFFNPASWTENLGPQVASAAAEEQPDAAIAIWRDLADRKIEGKNRGAYQEAAALPANAKATYERHDRTEEWPAFITELRERRKTLRALKEELDARDLR